jgi:hypothetical protein
MGKPDTAMVESTYGQALTILEGAPTAIAQGIKLLINTVLAGLDFGVIGDLVEWAINIVSAKGCRTFCLFLSWHIRRNLIHRRCQYKYNIFRFPLNCSSIFPWQVVKAVCDMKAKALSIALRCEYMLRAGKVNFTTMKKAFNLTNKCSKCKCIGHNKTNHPTEIDTFLIDKQLDDLADAATDLVTGVDAAEQDGYWDWLSGTIM